MCGIFGIINAKKQPFNNELFNVLGILNDARGGDSCGVFIDGTLEYGTEKEKYFYDFLQTSKILKNTKFSTIALGHCRKASVGSISKKTAQPVVIYKNNKPDFVLIHNGTIYNYGDLAKKYIPNIDITGMTDSQVMANIFYNAGYDCLSEYYGGSVFFIVDYRSNPTKILMFRGSSREYEYINSDVKEERPFYFTYINKSFVFSSIPTYFKAFKPNATVNTITSNILIELRNSELYCVKEYDRSSVSQSGQYRFTNGYENYSSYNSASKQTTPIKTIAKPYYDWYDDDDDDMFTESSGLISSYNETNTKQYIYYANRRDRYIMDSKNVTGTYSVNKYGRLHADSTKDTLYELHFWDGILLKNKNCFNFLNALRKKSNVNLDDFIYAYPDLLYYLSAYPLREDPTDPESPFVVGDVFDQTIYSGVLHKVLSGKQYTVSEGKVINEWVRCSTENDFKAIWNKKDRILFGELRKFYLG